jgi:hypothetical protein
MSGLGITLKGNNRTMFTVGGIKKNPVNDRKKKLIQAVSFASMSSTNLLEAKQKLKFLMMEANQEEAKNTSQMYATMRNEAKVPQKKKIIHRRKIL